MLRVLAALAFVVSSNAVGLPVSHSRGKSLRFASMGGDDCTIFKNPGTARECMAKINAGINPGSPENGDVQTQCHWCSKLDGSEGRCVKESATCWGSEAESSEWIDRHSFFYNNVNLGVKGKRLPDDLRLQDANAGLRYQLSMWSMDDFFAGIYNLDWTGIGGDAAQADRTTFCNGFPGKDEGSLNDWFVTYESEKLAEFDFTNYKMAGPMDKRVLGTMTCTTFCKDLCSFYCKPAKCKKCSKLCTGSATADRAKKEAEASATAARKAERSSQLQRQLDAAKNGVQEQALRDLDALQAKALKEGQCCSTDNNIEENRLLDIISGKK